jgi:catechol 2,3-dioxygenase-like lactoylglutathione lyase family enzyme
MTDDAKPPLLDQVTIVVSDMPAALEFYRRLGVTVGEMPPPWDAHHRSARGVVGGGHDLDFDSEAYASKWNQGHTAGRTGVLIGFRCPDRDSVDRTFADLTGAGYKSQQAPFDAFWGARYAIVEDPDGNPVGLMSPLDPATASGPPDPST